MVCCVFDELSAISCIETIKQGFDVKIIVCYNKKSISMLKSKKPKKIGHILVDEMSSFFINSKLSWEIGTFIEKGESKKL